MRKVFPGCGHKHWRKKYWCWAWRVEPRTFAPWCSATKPERLHGEIIHYYFVLYIMIRFSTQSTIGDVFTQCFSPFKRSVVWQQPKDAKLFEDQCKSLRSSLQIYSFWLLRSHLLKVPVIIGPKMLFFRHQWLWNSNYKLVKKTTQNRLDFERIPASLFLRLKS